MGFYILLFGLTLIITFLEFFNIKREKYIIYLLSIIYILISGLRWNNVDWDIYYIFFMNNYSLDDFWYNSMPIDKGFGLINFIVKSFTDNYSVLLFILAVVIITIKVRFILKFSMIPLLSILYWYGVYLGDIFFIRQSLAVAITLLACRFIIKKQLVWFLFFSFIAMTIQISTISFILAYFIFHKKIKMKYWILGLIGAIFIGRFLDNSLLIQINGIVNVIPIDSERLANKVYSYMYIHDYSNENANAILGYIRRLVFVPLEMWAVLKMDKINNNYRGFVNLVIFGYILYFIFGNVGQVFAVRLNSAYVIYEIITIPSIFVLIKSLKLKIILFLILAGYLFYRYIYFIDMNSNGYIPYVNILLN